VVAFTLPWQLRAASPAQARSRVPSSPSPHQAHRRTPRPETAAGPWHSGAL